MSYRQLREFLTNFGIKPGCRAITLNRMTLVIRTARKWYGPLWARGIYDLFMPSGKVVIPGFEDSLSHYQFMPGTWKELREDWD